MGIAVRAAYDYANRYLFEFNAGYNGSENFAKGHRFGFFPSVSVGWNISCLLYTSFNMISLPLIM